MYSLQLITQDVQILFHECEHLSQKTIQDDVKQIRLRFSQLTRRSDVETADRCIRVIDQYYPLLFDEDVDTQTIALEVCLKLAQQISRSRKHVSFLGDLLGRAYLDGRVSL